MNLIFALFGVKGQVLCMSRLEDTVEDAEFIFEAVIEDLEIKKDLFESKFLLFLFHSLPGASFSKPSQSKFLDSP